MRPPPFDELEVRLAIGESLCWSDALRKLGYRPVGHNIRTLQRWARRPNVATPHFDPNQARRRANRHRKIPIQQILVENSSYSRGHLKGRLFEEGIKEPRCELCGQGELWRGKRISLVLDHINGIGTDNRIENLRIVCPNCAASLDTHCGRNLPRERECARCGKVFAPKHLRHRHCSKKCGTGWDRTGVQPGFTRLKGVPRPQARKVERPPYEQLLREIEETSYLAVGRKYGVSDNAIRKWVRWYERERADREASAHEAVTDALSE